MKILASEKLSEHKFKDTNGYLICTDCILSRTGKQTYHRDEVFCDGSNEEVEIDRVEDEVFSPESLASFENCPVCINHPDVNVTPDNHNELSVGFVRNVRKGDYEGNPVMIGDLVITDAKAIDLIENGEMTELSCGYDCDIKDEENPQQRNIRGNHIALCEQGRAGIARIIDSIDDENINDIEKQYKQIRKWGNWSIIEIVDEDLVKAFNNRKYIVGKYYNDALQDFNKGSYYKTLEKAEDALDEIHRKERKNSTVDSVMILKSKEKWSIIKRNGEFIVIENYNKQTGKGTYEYPCRNMNEAEKVFNEYLKHTPHDSIDDVSKYLFEISYLDRRSDNTESAFIEASNKDEAKEIFKKQFKGKYDRIFDVSVFKEIKDSLEDNAKDTQALRNKIVSAKSLKELKQIMVEVDAHKDEGLLLNSEYNTLVKLSETIKESFNDSIEDGKPLENAAEVDKNNYVIGKNGIWFAKNRQEKNLLSTAYCSNDKGKTWYRCYVETKSADINNRTQTGKYLFRTPRGFDGPRTSIGRNVLTWYAANGIHSVDYNLEIDHKDQDYTNDKLSNLRRVTPEENKRNITRKKDSISDTQRINSIINIISKLHRGE